MYDDSGLLFCNAMSVLQTVEKHQTRDTKSHPRIPGPSAAPLWGPQILVTCGCVCMFVHIKVKFTLEQATKAQWGGGV
jgi:hypothetical protein